MDNLFVILYIITIIPISLTIHEFAHALVSYSLGDPTAKNMGRLTLNPIKHLDVFGTLIMVVSIYAGVGFGWAKPVPINPRYYKNTKKGTMLVSIAGPLANLLLAFVATFPLVFVYYRYNLQTLAPNDFKVILYELLSRLFMTNISLAIFNLIPVPPLDGSKILAGILPSKQYYKYLEYERYISFAFMILIFASLYLFPNFLGTITNPIGRLFINIASPIVRFFV